MPDVSAVEAEAVKALRGCMSTDIIQGSLAISFSIEVYDEKLNLVRVVHFGDAVRMIDLTSYFATPHYVGEMQLEPQFNPRFGGGICVQPISLSVRGGGC